ncbi:MAG: hypothetical protein RL497_2902 [Pseudomonadota bacterium]
MSKQVFNFRSIAKASSLVLGISCSLNAFAAFNAAPPATGALASGTYRNLAAEMGKTDGAAKRDDAWNKMFGTDTNYRIYETLGSDMAYMKTPDSNDVRTEGQSWGLTVAVMMNKQAEFDKLWRFAATHQRNTTGSYPGTFAWQVKFDSAGKPYKADAGAAPDGEEYMAFALLNADARWGSSGAINYLAEAKAVLTAVRTHLMVNGIIVFSPSVGNVTDPSYHIPAFYSYFAQRLTDQADKDYWNGVANSSRTFLQTHLASAPNGLPTYLASPAGAYLTGNLFTGQPNPAHIYEYDAWRVALNIGLDAHLMGAQPWHKTAVNTIHNFLLSKQNSETCYKQKYEYGVAVASNNYCADVGQKAANAVGLLAGTSATNANFFFEQFWSSSFPSGTYRYYGGSLYMLSLLHAIGEFKFHMPAATPPATPPPVTPPAATNKLLNGTFDNALTSWNYNSSSGAAATFSVVSGAAKIAITNAGTANYHVQFSQAISIVAGKKYKLDFDARVTEGTSRTIGANIEKSASPYTGYGSSTHNLTSAAAHFTYTFNAVSASDSGARLVFQLGANANDVTIDNVTLVEQ